MKISGLHARKEVAVRGRHGNSRLRLLNRKTHRPEARLPRQTRTPVLLRHLCHTLPIQPDLADAFDTREHIVDSLAADAHQLGANDARDEIARKIEKFPRPRTFEALAKNSRQ